MSLLRSNAQIRANFHRAERVAIILIRAYQVAVDASKTFMRQSCEVEAAKVHYLGPRRNKVIYELHLGVLASIDFREGPKLRV